MSGQFRTVYVFKWVHLYPFINWWSLLVRLCWAGVSGTLDFSINFFVEDSCIAYGQNQVDCFCRVSLVKSCFQTLLLQYQRDLTCVLDCNAETPAFFSLYPFLGCLLGWKNFVGNLRCSQHGVWSKINPRSRDTYNTQVGDSKECAMHHNMSLPCCLLQWRVVSKRARKVSSQVNQQRVYSKCRMVSKRARRVSSKVNQRRHMSKRMVSSAIPFYVAPFRLLLL